MWLFKIGNGSLWNLPLVVIWETTTFGIFAVDIRDSLSWTTNYLGKEPHLKERKFIGSEPQQHNGKKWSGVKQPDKRRPRSSQWLLDMRSVAFIWSLQVGHFTAYATHIFVCRRRSPGIHVPLQSICSIFCSLWSIKPNQTGVLKCYKTDPRTWTLMKKAKLLLTFEKERFSWR